MAVAKTDISTFPAIAIEQQIRELLTKEAEVQATLQGATGGERDTSSGWSSIAEPNIDSLVAVEVLVMVESLVPFALSESLIRPGGYTRVEDFINDLLSKLNHQWLAYHRGEAS